MTPPAGLIIELVTPLTPQGRLDGDSLARLVRRLTPHADGLLAASPVAGEGLVLPQDLRLELLSHLLDLVEDRPLLFAITGETAEETLTLAESAAKERLRRGQAGPLWLADLPLWYHSNRGLPGHLGEVAAAAGLPLVVLNLPAVVRQRAAILKHRNLRTQVVKKLAARPDIVGLIYQGEMRRFLNYHLAAIARPDFAFYEADETRFLTRPGAWGVVSAGAMLMPETWQRVSRACLHPEEAADDFAGRRALLSDSQRLQALTGLYQHAPAALLKAALVSRGILKSDALAPGTPLPPGARKQQILAFNVH
jgi:dihydrodipicolinate synthase/N-acetylneuraminate lyase